MGINYSIDAEARVVRLSYVGEVSIGEFEATITAVFRSPDYRPGFGFLVDRRRTDPPTIEYTEGALGFALLHETELEGGRWALVVSDRLAVEMGHVGERLAARAVLPQPAQVFGDVEGAEAWLRVTAPEK